MPDEILEDEIEMEKEEEDYKPIPASADYFKKITSYNISNTVEVLIQKIDDGEINLRPEFQRDFVWDHNRASLFIDSLIIGLPIPSIFLGKRRKDESFIVIDGQQRLKSLYYFRKGKFQFNNKERAFKLHNLETRNWNNCDYDGLEEFPQRCFRNAVINTTIIENIDVYPKSIRDIFHRLNTGGMPLNDQEIRNCIFAGNFNKLLIEINNNSKWRSLLGKMSPSKRLLDVELILRFFSLFNNRANYRAPMRDFMGDFMEEHANEDASFNDCRKLFDASVEIIYDSIGRDAFRHKRYFNRAMCDSILVGVAHHIQNNSLTKDIAGAHSKLLKDKGFILYISESTTTETNVIGRIDTAIRHFGKN